MYTFCLLIIVLALFISVFNSRSVETVSNGKQILNKLPYLSVEPVSDKPSGFIFSKKMNNTENFTAPLATTDASGIANMEPTNKDLTGLEFQLVS